MKKSLLCLALAAALAACHGGSDSSLQRKDQQQYDVVQEGQASGVTSTINAPGEVAPPPAPMTGTNADTTSNFTLPQVAPAGSQPNQPGTLAGTLPQAPAGTTSAPGAPPRPRPVTHSTTTTTAATTATEPQRVEPRHVERTDTTGTSVEGPPPATSTVPPNTDTAPPPPPSNDTTGTHGNHNPPSNSTQPPPTTTTT